MTDRCEPLPELRGVDGWHVLLDGAEQIYVKWYAKYQWWGFRGFVFDPQQARLNGYRYLSPVATPAEVDALRAERDALRLGWDIAVREHDKLMAENTTLRARVSRLEEALKVAHAWIIDEDLDAAEWSKQGQEAYSATLAIVTSALKDTP